MSRLFQQAFLAVLQSVSGGGGGGDTPPEGMAFLFASNGEPITDKDGQPVYAKEPA